MTTRDDDEFERRIRRALSARAASVVPDPATWEIVQSRVRRGAWLRSSAVGLVTVAVAVIGILTAGDFLRPTREIDFAPATAPPSAPETVAPPTVASPTVAAPTVATPTAAPATEDVDVAAEDALGDDAGAATPAPTPSPTPAEPTQSQFPPDTSATEQPEPGTTLVSVAFLPQDAPCGEGVVLVGRRVPALTPLRGALEALLAGPTSEETDAGSTTALGDGGSLLHGVSINDGVARVDLAAAALPGTSGSSCQILAVIAQLDATVGQFASVDRATYVIDGSVDRFAAWAQSDAGELTARPVP